MSTPSRDAPADAQTNSTLSNGDSNPTSQPPQPPDASLEADIAQLTLLLSQDPPDDDTNIAELLARLESANGMAQGVESKLDGIIGNLDQLLSTLEAQSGSESPDAPESSNESKDSSEGKES
ncbi:hypothetical protein HGRIS_008545 [Hohenbuehelia grisea]|uniref:Uncharacterized protein n=1 Tax=Hohenbuehelia grisea TaxID=104357 RepID=A0ABR3J8A2_9AGAR